MCAARFLRPPSIASYSTFVAIAVSGIHGFAQRPRVSYDSPSLAHLPRDVHLVSQARGSLSRDEKLHADQDWERRQKTDTPPNNANPHTPAFEDDDLSAWAQ